MGSLRFTTDGPTTATDVIRRLQGPLADVEGITLFHSAGAGFDR